MDKREEVQKSPEEVQEETLKRLSTIEIDVFPSIRMLRGRAVVDEKGSSINYIWEGMDLKPASVLILRPDGMKKFVVGALPDHGGVSWIPEADSSTDADAGFYKKYEAKIDSEVSKLEEMQRQSDIRLKNAILSLTD